MPTPSSRRVEDDAVSTAELVNGGPASAWHAATEEVVTHRRHPVFDDAPSAKAHQRERGGDSAGITDPEQVGAVPASASTALVPAVRSTAGRTSSRPGAWWRRLTRRGPDTASLRGPARAGGGDAGPAGAPDHGRGRTDARGGGQDGHHLRVGQRVERGPGWGSGGVGQQRGAGNLADRLERATAAGLGDLLGSADWFLHEG